MSLRTRILLLVLVAMLPLIALLIYLQIEERANRIGEARRELAVLARATAQDLETRLRTAAQFTYALTRARLLDTPDRAACSAFLAETYRRFPEYNSLTTFLPNGELHCTSLREGRQANVADRAYFQRALASNEAQFEPLISRVSGAAIVMVAYAARDGAGKVKYVLVLPVNLERFTATAARTSQYEDTVVTLWDREGTLLARYSEDDPRKLTGQKLPEAALFRFARAGADGATAEVAGVDGIVRIYALSKLPETRGTGLRITMGVSRAELTAEADRYLRDTLLFSIVYLLVAVASVWTLAERGIRRPVARIMDTIGRLGDGDLDARIGRPYPRGELGHLMETLDRTADTLQQQRRELDELNTGLERRVAERTAELEASRREVAEQRNIYWSQLDASTDGLALAAHDRTLLHINRAFGRTLGLESVDGLIGRPVGEFRARLLPLLKEPEKYQQEMERLWTNPKARGDFELELLDGRVLHFYSTTVQTAAGELIGRSLGCRDVTREREVDRMKSEFVATVSHELRTPLASLLGFSELMLTRKLPEEKNKQFLEVIHKESKRLNTLINDFLDLQRIESGRVSYTLEQLHVASVVREVATLFSNDPQHPLRLGLPESLPPVLGDHDRIKQVLQNLLSNAVKFSPKGGEIAVAASATGDGMVEISVQDHGLGIPPEAMPKLFGKFYRVDSTDRREIGGTGLGLALCKEIVTAHHGRIRAESRMGAGSTFRFTLPVKPAAAATAATAPAAAKAGEEYVLVVEDDASFAALVREHLSTEGLAVRIEPAAEGALAAAHAAAPLLVILDIHLAGKMDGWDFLVEMKADRKLAEVPVIITTVTEKRARGFALGASDYLVKPFPMETLVEGIRRFLPEPEGKRVLVVDDDADFRISAVAMVKYGLHCEAEEAANGRQALEKIRQHIPDLVILDLLMPVMDGFAVLDALRARTETASLPVLVVTGKDLTPQDKEHLKQGMARVLTKAEYSRHRLLALVNELLKKPPKA